MSTPGYMIVRVNVHDWDAYREYMKHTPRVVKQYGGRFIARGANPETLEGEQEVHRIIVLQFPSVQDCKTFYDSEEYQEIKKFRLGGAATAQFIVIDGYPIDQWNQAVEDSEQQAK